MTEKPKKFPPNKQTPKNADDSASTTFRERITREAAVDESLAGNRLDQIAASLFPEFSRGKLQKWIVSGALTVDGQPSRSKQKIAEGCLIQLSAEFEPEVSWQPEARELDIVFELSLIHI